MIKRISSLSVIFLSLFLSNSFPAKQPVVAELMTATWCPACPYADSAVSDLVKKYGSSLVVLEYHPTSDEFGNERTDSRIEYYDVRGFPTIKFNGVEDFAGGGPGVVKIYEEKMKPLLNQVSGIDIALNGKLEEKTINASATISLDKKSSIAGMTLRWVLFENNAKGKEKNFNHVVRDIADAYATIKPGSQKTITHTFQIPSNVNRKNLGIVLLIQDDGSKEIVQASSLLLSSAKSK